MHGIRCDVSECRFVVWVRRALVEIERQRAADLVHVAEAARWVGYPRGAVCAASVC